MKKSIEAIIRLVGSVGQSEEDRLWGAWLDLGKKKEPLDLIHLLTLDVRKEFKVRALTVLLTPDLRTLPFRWDDTSDYLRNYLSMSRLKVEIFPQELVHFAGELVCQNIDCVIGKQDEKLLNTLFQYNKLILQFLEVLPEEDLLAERLFLRYSVNDPVTYRTMDEASGYNPLYNIFCAEKVPTKWKFLADEKMRERIIAEAEGLEQPREEWEVALQCYIEHIRMSNYGGREAYSRDLLASQIHFITELPNIEEHDLGLFLSDQMAHFMEAIPEDKRETRHKLARLIILGKTEGYFVFSALNQESRDMADRILLEFGTEDTELADKLNEQIAKTTQLRVNNAHTEHELQQKINSVLSQMS